MLLGDLVLRWEWMSQRHSRQAELHPYICKSRVCVLLVAMIPTRSRTGAPAGLASEFSSSRNKCKLSPRRLPRSASLSTIVFAMRSAKSWSFNGLESITEHHSTVFLHRSQIIPKVVLCSPFFALTQAVVVCDK